MKRTNPSVLNHVELAVTVTVFSYLDDRETVRACDVNLQKIKLIVKMKLQVVRRLFLFRELKVLKLFKVLVIEIDARRVSICFC